MDRMIRRSRDILARLMEHSEMEMAEVTEIVAGVICDGCRETVLVRAPTRTALEQSLPAALEGWTITEKPSDNDLCPKCTAGLAAA